MGYTRIMRRGFRVFSLSSLELLMKRVADFLPVKPNRANRHANRQVPFVRTKKAKTLKIVSLSGAVVMWVSLDRTTRYLATHPSRLTAPLGAIESCGRVQAFFVATFFFDRKSILDLLQLSSFLPFFWFSKMVLKEKHKDGAGRPVIFDYYLLRTSSLNGGVCWILSWKRSRWLFVGTKRYPTRRTSVLSKHPSHMTP